MLPGDSPFLMEFAYDESEIPAKRNAGRGATGVSRGV